MSPTICRSAEDPTKPCQFTGSCSAIRQMIQDRAGARGMDCDFFAAITQRLAYEPRDPEAA